MEIHTLTKHLADRDHSAGRRPVWLQASLGAMATGALLASCYWPLNLHNLAWIALVPWLMVMPRVRAGWCWIYGTLGALVFYRIGLSWMVELAGPIGVAVVVVLSVWMGLAFRVTRLLMDRFGPPAMLWATPLAFVGQEVLRSEALPQFRFSYLGLGYSQSHNLWIAQLASVGGVYFVSLLVVLVNASVAYALWQRHQRAWRPLAGAAGFILIAGWLSQPRMAEPESAIPVAIVQGEDLTYAEFLELAQEATASPTKPEFIVLPEHTASDYVSERHPLISRLADLAVRGAAYVCVGVHIRAQSDHECPYDNVALLIGPDGQWLGTQAKVVPVPLFQDGNPADRQKVFATTSGSVGILVCYDATFTDAVRRVTAMGAEFWLVPVMDPADWPIQQRYQHADMARFRSIEMRRWAVRAASSGISQIIDPTGRVVAQRGGDEGPGVLLGYITARQERTAFSLAGHWLAKVIGGGFVAVVIALTIEEWAGRLGIRRRPAG